MHFLVFQVKELRGKCILRNEKKKKESIVFDLILIAEVKMLYSLQVCKCPDNNI